MESQKQNYNRWAIRGSNLLDINKLRFHEKKTVKVIWYFSMLKNSYKVIDNFSSFLDNSILLMLFPLRCVRVLFSLQFFSSIGLIELSAELYISFIKQVTAYPPGWSMSTSNFIPNLSYRSTCNSACKSHSPFSKIIQDWARGYPKGIPLIPHFILPIYYTSHVIISSLHLSLLFYLSFCLHFLLKETTKTPSLVI